MGTFVPDSFYIDLHVHVAGVFDVSMHVSTDTNTSYGLSSNFDTIIIEIRLKGGAQDWMIQVHKLQCMYTCTLST